MLLFGRSIAPRTRRDATRVETQPERALCNADLGLARCSRLQLCWATISHRALPTFREDTTSRYVWAVSHYAHCEPSGLNGFVVPPGRCPPASAMIQGAQDWARRRRLVNPSDLALVCVGAEKPRHSAPRPPTASQKPIILSVDSARVPMVKPYMKAFPKVMVDLVTYDGDANGDGTIQSKVAVFNRVGHGWPGIIFSEEQNDVASLGAAPFNYARSLNALVPSSVIRFGSPGSPRADGSQNASRVPLNVAETSDGAQHEQRRFHGERLRELCPDERRAPRQVHRCHADRLLRRCVSPEGGTARTHRLLVAPLHVDPELHLRRESLVTSNPIVRQPLGQQQENRSRAKRTERRFGSRSRLSTRARQIRG